MKRLLPMVLLFSLVPAGHAEVSCIKKDKSCDRKEQCMYERQIEMKKQLQALYGDADLRKQAVDLATKEYPGKDQVTLIQRSHRARDIFQELFEKKVMDGKTIKLTKCGDQPSDNPGIRNPYSMYTDQNCDIHYVNDRDQEASKEEALALNTCAEFNAAARVHELWHVNRCQWAKANPSEPAADRRDLDTYINEEKQAYQHEISYLEEEKSWQKQRCTPTKQQAKNAGKTIQQLMNQLGL